MESSYNMLPNNNYSNTINKINSSNNSSHVEALFLYLGNKLVEMGKCPTFPYYYGCINAIDNNYYYNIDEEYDNIKDEDWFISKIENNLELIEVDIDDDSTTESSFNTSLRDSDIDNLEKLLQDVDLQDNQNNEDENLEDKSELSDNDEPKITEIETDISDNSNSSHNSFIEELDINDDLLDNMDLDFNSNNDNQFNNLDIDDDLIDLNNSVNESSLNNIDLKTKHKLEAM